MKRLLVLLTLALLLAACGKSSTPGLGTTLATETAPAHTARASETAVSTPQATDTTVPTSVPAPIHAATSTLAHVSASSLGEPILLGRGQITDAAFTPDGAAVVIGWASGVSLVAVADVAERWWRPTGGPAIAVDVHPNGQSVAAALADGSILILDAATGSPGRYDGARPHAYWGDVAWSPDGRQIAFQFIGPRRGDPIYLLDVTRGSLGEVPGSRIDEGTLPYLAWSPDSRAITLAGLGEDCPRVLDARTGETVLVLQVEGACSSPWDIVWSPDGRRIAAGGDLIDPHGGDVVGELEGGGGGFGPGRPGWPIRFSPDGAYVAAGGQASGPGELSPIVVWDAGTGQVVARFSGAGVLSEQEESVPRVAIAFDGESLFTLYEDGQVARWTFGDGGPEGAVLGRVSVIAARPPLSWSADGCRFAAGNRYGGAAAWESATGRLLASFDEPLDAPALSPSGRLLALTDREREELVLFDLDASQVASRLPGARSMPTGVAFSPDGAQIAYGSGNRVLLADAISGQQTTVLEGHPQDQLISRIIWSPDGNALVSASGVPGDSAASAPLVLWQRDDGGAWAEVLRAETTRAGYDCCVPLALFNPVGDLIALEELPGFEAKDLKVVVYDRKAGQVVLSLPEYELAGWISEEVLLTSEAQYDTRLTRWNVRTGESEVSSGREMGDNAYAPGGLIYARPNDQDPYYVRGIQIHSWETERAIDRDIYDSDVFQILWSSDGRLVAALVSNGVIVVWPFDQ